MGVPLASFATLDDSEMTEASGKHFSGNEKADDMLSGTATLSSTNSDMGVAHAGEVDIERDKPELSSTGRLWSVYEVYLRSTLQV